MQFFCPKNQTMWGKYGLIFFNKRVKIMVYAYIRVSTDKQDCDNQKLGIEIKAKSLGLVVDKYVKDAGISGTREPEKRALGGLLKKLKRGDIVICSELSRFGRKLFMIMRILEYCMKNGVMVYTVKDGYELGDNIQSKVLAFAFGISAEIERDLISQRTKEALARRKADGRTLGRRYGSVNKTHKLDGKARVIRKALSEKITKKKIAKRLKVSIPTLNKYIKNNITPKETTIITQNIQIMSDEQKIIVNNTGIV